MFITQQNNQIISDIDYKDPSQVEQLRQQLIHQYENHCYGSKRISVTQQKKYNKQALNANNNREYKDQKKQVKMNQEFANRSLEYENQNQNSIQNERIRQALSQSITPIPNSQEVSHNLYKVDAHKKSVSRKRNQNPSPLPFGNYSQKIENMKDNEIQNCLKNQVYMSPLIQNCLEEEIITQECQRYSSAPSKKYLEMYDYSKDKLSQMYAKTGCHEIGKIYERMESPEKSQNLTLQPYQVELSNQLARGLNSQLLVSNKSSIHQSQSQIQPNKVSFSVNSQTSTKKNPRIEGNKSMNLSQQNPQEDIKDSQKKLEFVEQYDISKSRNSEQIIKSQNIQSYEQNRHWTVQKKRNSTGIINQLIEFKQNEENFQFTHDQRHPHQLIKNSGIYLRNKPEYLSDPRYKLIENLNKISQSVNVKNINNHSVREGKIVKNKQYRIIPYCHNFIQSYKDSFYYPQTNFENNFKICNPRKSLDKKPLPHQAVYTRKSATTPRDKQSREQSPFEEKAIMVTPFLEKEIYSNDYVEIRIPNKVENISKPTLESEENTKDEEEFQYYQSSMNKYNALYLNRNQRVRLSRNSSPDRMKKLNALHKSVDSSSISKNLNKHNQPIYFEDPRKEYREKQKKLEELLNIATKKKISQQQEQNLTVQDRYTTHQDSLYLKKTRNYATPYRNNQINNASQQYQSNTDDYTLNAYVFKQSNN